jgi:hypothetical protein
MSIESFRFEPFAITVVHRYIAAKIVKTTLQVKRMIAQFLEQNIFLIEKPIIFAKILSC